MWFDIDPADFTIPGIVKLATRFAVPTFGVLLALTAQAAMFARVRREYPEELGGFIGSRSGRLLTYFETYGLDSNSTSLIVGLVLAVAGFLLADQIQWILDRLFGLI